MPVDTSRLSNGQHQLSVTVEDAAGNSSVVYDGTISTSNAVADASSAELSDGSGGVGLGPANGSKGSRLQRVKEPHCNSSRRGTSLRVMLTAVELLVADFRRRFSYSRSSSWA